jgi:ATP-dependent RNA helicase HrpB
VAERVVVRSDRAERGHRPRQRVDHGTLLSSQLPIERVLPVLVTAVRERGACVLTAPPGSGKTTRVPPALLDAVDGEIVVVEPWRLAARLAAVRIATERIKLVTPSVLTRRMRDDPELRGVGCVIIDEFQARHLGGDVALALCARLRERRPELQLVVMAAGLHPEAIGRYLGGARILHAEGVSPPVAIEHADQPDDRPLGERVAAAVRRLAQDELDGHVLVFLPDGDAITRCADALVDVAASFDLAVVPLHGEVSADDEDAAMRPASRRKVILATKVAETGVTVDGVVAVIDSGLSRVTQYSAWSGLPSLHVEPVSRASCMQRASRAGHTRPGRAIRLYTKADFDARRPFEVPEVLRADLARTALELHGVGTRLGELRWFEPPPRVAMAAADDLLARLGAANPALTPLGRRMLRFGVHPRQSRLICEAEDRGVAPEACAIAALLGAPELRFGRRRAKLGSPSDLVDDLDAFLDARRDGVATIHAVDRVARELEAIADCDRPAPDAVERELQIAILTAFPDRVGTRAPDGTIAFASGHRATLAASSRVLDAPLVVAVDDTLERASAIEASWLRDLYPDRVVERVELAWNGPAERVERVVQLVYDGLAIDESRHPAEPAPAAGELLATHALAAGIARFVDTHALATWRARVALVRTLEPGVVAPPDAQILVLACERATSFEALRAVDLMTLLETSLGGHRATLARLAPTHVELPGRRVPIHYELDQPPWIASPMQDFFGLAHSPAVGDGRVPLVLHLLAPNERPLETTQDLAGFWATRYPALREQLVRRYPKHAWPEDPTK